MEFNNWLKEKEIFLTDFEIKSEIEMAYYDFIVNDKYNDFKQYLEDKTRVVTIENPTFDEVFSKFIEDKRLEQDKIIQSLD